MANIKIGDLINSPKQNAEKRNKNEEKEEYLLCQAEEMNRSRKFQRRVKEIPSPYPHITQGKVTGTNDKIFNGSGLSGLYRVTIS